MIRNYFKVALRAITRNKLSSFINIFGLALAMACSLMIFLYIKDELAYDRYNEKADRIYRVTRNFLSPDGSVNLHLGHVAPPAGPLLKNDFPDFEEVVRTLQTRFLIAYQENGEEKKAFNEDNTFYAEPEIFKVFTIPMIEGNPEKSLEGPNQVIMSESTAKKYFGNESALGKPLKIGNRLDMVVTGVFKNFPAQSHWHPDVMVSFSTLNDSTIYGRRGLETNWGNNSFGTYALVKEPFDQKKVESQFPAFLDKHMGPIVAANGGPLPSKFTNLFLQKLTDIHLHSQLDSEVETNGSISNVYMMGVIGWLNDFTGKSLQLNFIENWPLLIGFLLFAVVVGVMAGIYPAFVISGFKPALILKGQQGSAKGKSTLRKFLVVTQFSISIVLIIATMITYQQLQFLNNRELGYNKNQVVSLRFFGDLAPNYDAFHNELLKQSSIKNVSRSSRTPTGRLLDSQGTAQIQKGDSLMNTNVVLKNIRVDVDFFDVYEVPFVSGRNFSLSIPTDDSLAFVLNESAVKMMESTPEEILTKDFQYGGVRGRVIGVVKDFHFESLREAIVPMVFHPSQFYGRLSVKIAGDRMQEGLQHIEKVWKDFIPHRPFEYSFLSQQYEQLYNAEQNQGQLFTIFSGLAILIACLGLFGLATFNTLQRVKEIGIRKVLGASVFNIVQLLSREIIVLIVIANIIAWPVAYYFMNQWLDGFAYKIGINIWLYALAAVVAIMIALITVGTQTIRAARTNPANTLRYE